MRRVHYIYSSHWDREWYQSFQDFRYRLVQLIDRTLNGWQTGSLRGPFFADGQSILLEDYLEVRPERAEEVRQRVKEGLFVLGPFYVQPDEFLVSGESLIRNLQIGRKIVRQFGGEPSNAGLLADNFGHNSQMPQIFAGFGIRAAFLWRGVNLVDRRLFVWRGADGAEMPCYRFGAEGYCSYAKFVRQQRLDEPRFSREQIRQRLEAFLQEENDRTRLGPLLAFDGGDHMEWDPDAYTVLQQEMDNDNGLFDIVHSSLDDYMAELAPLAGKIDFTLQGELRETGRFPEHVDKAGLAQSTGSSRVWIKQANAACEDLLCRWAEPFAAFAHFSLKTPYPHGFLEAAWKWLVQNHAHDSICGCSIDAVHADMDYRFRQAVQIGERLAMEATRKLAAGVQGVPANDELRCTVFNPLPRPFRQAAVLDLEIPAEWSITGLPGQREEPPVFRIYDACRKEIPYQRMGVVPNRARLRIYDTAFPRAYAVNLVRVALPLDIPPSGYTTLSIRAGADAFPVRFPQPAAYAGLTGNRSMSNEYLSVTIETSGGITLHDKRIGAVYRDLLTYEDAADIGNAWNYRPAQNNRIHLSSGCRSEIIQLHDGPYLASFLIRTGMDLPEEYDRPAMERSRRLVSYVIESKVMLRAGACQLDIETVVHNNARDHRLRVLFPTDADASTYLSDTPFDVVERPIGLAAGNHLYRQAEMETRPQQSWTAVCDGQRGLAVLSPGLYESAVIDAPQRTIALSLLRAYQHTVYTNGEPGGQVQGRQTFRFALVPLTGEVDRAALYDAAAWLGCGLRTVQLTSPDVRMHQQEFHPLPERNSFLSLEGPVVLTGLRLGGAGLEARLFNPNVFPAQAVLCLSNTLSGQLPLNRAAWVDFEGETIHAPLPLRGGELIVELAPKQIKTIQFT